MPDRTITGTVRVGRLMADRSTWFSYTDAALSLVLLNIPAGHEAADLAIEAEKGAAVTFVDYDTHHWLDKPTTAALQRWLDEITMAADCGWLTHGSGLRAVFVGPHHRARAVAAALSAPKSFKVEIKDRSRHPLSTRADKPGATCGTIVMGSVDPAAPYTFKLDGNFTTELRQQALAELGFIDGERYAHDRCPIDPNAHTAAQACVTVYDNLVHCYRCAGNGVRYRPALPPGVFPLAVLIGLEATDLERLAAHWVHWEHAKVELTNYYPNLGPEVIKEAYRLALEARWGVTDPRIAPCFSPALDFLWAGTWINATTHKCRKVDNDAASASPYCQYVAEEEKEKDGQKVKALVARVEKGRKSQFMQSQPAGYRPVYLYRGILLRADAATIIPLRCQSNAVVPVALLLNPLNEKECIDTISRAYPDINPAYLRGALAAAICAGRGGGRKPQICADGPTGAGKGETVRLAASFLDDDVTKVRVSQDEESISRCFGHGLTEGRRFFVIDELGRAPNLFQKLGTLLQFSSSLTWRPLYGAPTTTPFDAAIFYPSATFPSFLTHSSEFCRRTRRIRLSQQPPEWEIPTNEWRNLSPQNAKVANSLLTHVYNLCASVEYRWDKAADLIGLGRLDDDMDAPGLARYQALYRYCRGEMGPPAMASFDDGLGWVDLGAGPAQKLINALTDYDTDNLGKQRHTVKKDLEARPWNNIVGYRDPPIRLSISIRSGQWGCRFQTTGRPKGHELINQQLPPLAGAAPVAVGAVPDKAATGMATLERAGL